MANIYAYEPIMYDNMSRGSQETSMLLYQIEKKYGQLNIKHTHDLIKVLTISHIL